MKDNIWSEIRSNFEDEGIIHIDAWVSPDDDEEGKVIATIDIKTKTVTYRDDRAKTDAYAQETIALALKDINLPEEDANFAQFMVEMKKDTTCTNGLNINSHKKYTGKIADLSFGTDVRGDCALFIEEKHFTKEWELDEEAKSEIKGLTFFRVIRGGIQQPGHGWIDNGEIVQWG
jgi:hypothetical protein